MKRRGLAFAFQDKSWKLFKHGVPDSEVKPACKRSVGAERCCISVEWDSAFQLTGISSKSPEIVLRALCPSSQNGWSLQMSVCS